MKALCFGSLNIDYTYKVDHFVQKGETISSTDLNVFAGGKGLNQSIAIAKAGADAYHAGAIGEDGRFLLDAMNEAGVNTKYVDIRSDIRSGNALIQNDKNGDNCIILFGGANRAITKSQVDSVLADFSGDDLIVLQNEINELAYIMEKAHEIGMKIVLNPSPMNEIIKTLPLEYVDIFMLNEVEAGQLLDLKEHKEGRELADALSKMFPGAMIVLTLGEEGAICVNGLEVCVQPAFKVEAVDTTAAGDTFTGYFVKGITGQMPIREAMLIASKASSIAVTRQGAAPSIPTFDEVMEAM